MKSIDIKGKPYFPVSERLKYFWEHYPDHTIRASIIELTPTSVVMVAKIKDNLGVTVAKGHAREEMDNSLINKKSWLENCETSAWGRALANFKIGVEFEIASYDEVAEEILVDAATLEKIVKLLKSSSLTPSQAEQIESESSGYSQERANRCIDYLWENQLDPISSGRNYNQNDIQKKLDKVDKDPKK